MINSSDISTFRNSRYQTKCKGGSGVDRCVYSKDLEKQVAIKCLHDYLYEKFINEQRNAMLKMAICELTYKITSKIWIGKLKLKWLKI
ncbi:hypothetical protein Glove_365g212 [Diversispora epigaea]|uniref:Uncharacterized protein n=1 Tax=Diversispora epigaea TaxID=1348612 RepID=A0A397HBW8_9GLOM|nr:hypothetical protein Glove_365g212 [Diversispora epigaea]